MKTLWTETFRKEGNRSDHMDRIGDFSAWAEAIPVALHPVTVLERGIRFQAGPLGSCELVLLSADYQAGVFVFGDTNGKPFPLKLTAKLDEVSTEETEIFVKLEGDVNPFMWTMLKKPLEGFLSARFKG